MDFDQNFGPRLVQGTEAFQSPVCSPAWTLTPKQFLSVTNNTIIIDKVDEITKA